jgi:hypothetical protein
MERAKRPYSIQKRITSKKNRSVYYVQFRDSETAQYMTAVSSGKSSKSKAMNWADEQIKSGRVIASDKKNITFETYATEFWDWDKSLDILDCTEIVKAIDKGKDWRVVFERGEAKS